MKKYRPNMTLNVVLFEIDSDFAAVSKNVVLKSGF